MLERLLAWIGLDEPPAPDLDGLRRAHRAFLETVPYENIAVQLGELAPLDPPALARHMTAGRRGGYCFELNAVLAWMLEALGFAVARHEAVVGGSGPTNHMALVVEAGGSRWLADAGLGEGFVDPLPLREGRHGPDGGFAWTVTREPAGTWWVAQHEWSSFSGFRMAPEPSPLAAFEPHHRRLSTSPESVFVQTLCLQRPATDRITSLRARTLTVVGPAVDTRRVVEDRARFAGVLAGEFGIDVAVLGGERVDRLWAAACAQHEAWLRSRAGD